jgi:hypothetical protein
MEAHGVVPLLDDVPENPHHAFSLLFCEALFLQSLYKLERVEVVVSKLRRRCAEVASSVMSRAVTRSTFHRTRLPYLW